jgi:hypothetical protein
MNKLAVLLAPLMLMSPVLATANTIEAAGTCLTDNTSGKDRKVLVKWIFLAISKHPDISDLASASPAAIEKANVEVGALYTRLIAEDCATEIKAMLKEHGAGAIGKPFEVLGGVAMGELMSNPAVSDFLGQLEKYTDSARIGEVMKAD